jgi:hypothetical protein
VAYGRAMRQLARVCLVGIIASGALGLSGCVPAAPGPTPNAAASSKPVFESDAAALVAATKAYAAYLAMSDTISQEGGANPERLATLVTPEWLSKEIGSAQNFAGKGLHQVGGSKFDRPRLQVSDQSEEGVASVSVYLCLDVSNARIADESQRDVTPQRDRIRLPFVATFTGESKRLLLSGNVFWKGKDYC